MQERSRHISPVPASAQPPYCVYVLRCEDNSLYTGITTDIVRRIREHVSQAAPGARYTRSRKPEELVALWTAPDRSTASRLEYRIKHLDRNSKDHLVFYPHTVGEVLDHEEVRPFEEPALARFWNEAVGE